MKTIPRPHSGGRYVRDGETGALRRLAPDEALPAAAPAPTPAPKPAPKSGPKAASETALKSAVKEP